MKNATRVILLIVAILAFGTRPTVVAAEGDTYAAIAFSPSTVHWAYVNGEKTKEQALAHALKKCTALMRSPTGAETVISRSQSPTAAEVGGDRRLGLHAR